MSIFWRIFLSFWLLMVLTTAVAIISSFRLAENQPQNLDEIDRRDVLDSAAEVLSSEGLEGFRLWIENPENLPDDLTLYLLDENGNEALGRRPPNSVHRLRGPDRRGRFGGRRSQNRRPPFVPEFLAPDGKPYRPVIGPVPPPVLGMLGVPRVAFLALTIGILISAMICYLLARYLTRPIAQVVAATHKLAKGQLHTRTGVAAHRKDEVGQLARQFDEMASDLEQQTTSRQNLFRNISHELRSPLARIKVALELAARNPDAARLQLDRIGLEADQIDRMIGQVLDLVRVQQHDYVKPATIDLITLVDQIAADAAFEGKPQNKTISWNPAKSPVTVIGYESLLRSVIENVLRNAVTYTTENSTIEITLGDDNAHAVLSVRDQGPGVPENELANLFEPFYRFDQQPGIAGSGVGLAITAQGIKLMGGTVTARNAKEGGLIISMTFPHAIDA